ncbi:hypothetical protein V6R21_07640 [Limibacter armeniacum]|uniref:hypothetical protein n=1 Tax=Limibacter armeniacum TaxID=466084 RepID=UPI002FE6B7B7
MAQYIDEQGTIGDIEHEFTDSIICPYCGFEEQESWEYHHNEDEINCPDCNRKFAYERIFSYSTYRIDDTNDEQ